MFKRLSIISSAILISMFMTGCVSDSEFKTLEQRVASIENAIEKENNNINESYTNTTELSLYDNLYKC